MGAGAGKTRRSQAVILPARKALGLPKRIAGHDRQSIVVPSSPDPVVKCVEKAWGEYIKRVKIGAVTAAQYYLEEKKNTPLTSYEKTLIINELYKDAVDVGALVLPAGVKAEDFTWTVLSNGGMTDTLEPEHSLLDEFSQKVYSENFMEGRFGRNTKMVDFGLMIHYLTRCLSDALDARLDADWQTLT